MAFVSLCRWDLELVYEIHGSLGALKVYIVIWSNMANVAFLTRYYYLWQCLRYEEHCDQNYLWKGSREDDGFEDVSELIDFKDQLKKASLIAVSALCQFLILIFEFCL